MGYEIYQGEAAALLRERPSNSVDSVVTDPPSGTNMIIPFRQSGDDSRYIGFDSPLGKLRYNFKTQAKVALRFRECFQRDVWPVLKETARVLKPGGYGLFWGLHRSLHWLSWGLEEAGLAVLDVITFNVPPKRLKSPLVGGSKSTQLIQRTELWVLVRKPGENTASQNQARWGTGYMEIVLGGAERISNLQQAKRARHVTRHPTKKPVSQMRDLVRLVTPSGGVVLDPFMGSGTTGVAALQEGFSFLGIEREEQWVTVAKERLEGLANPIDDFFETLVYEE